MNRHAPRANSKAIRQAARTLMKRGRPITNSAIARHIDVQIGDVCHALDAYQGLRGEIAILAAIVREHRRALRKVSKRDTAQKQHRIEYGAWIVISWLESRLANPGVLQYPIRRMPSTGVDQADLDIAA